MNNLSKTFRYINANNDSITFTYENGYLINKPAGVDTLSVTLSEAQGINQVGSTVQSVNVKSRPVTISGLIVSDVATNKNRLLSVIRPDLSGKLYADDYYLNVYPTATPTIDPKPEFSAFQFSLKAPYPYWQKDDSFSKALSGVIPRFKFPWNMSREYQFGEPMATQFINVYNSGQVPIPFTAVFTAANDVSTPIIRNVTTNEVLQINHSLVQGEIVTLEITHDRTYCTSSVNGDIRGALSLTNTFNRLAVGDNVLKPEAAAGLGNLKISLNFSTEITGIAL